ncbi:uncharacterized protein I206_107143 [Kwoniella pini CBS 10737]|uniref:Uncharacterized protein n=1 Tax=Kwoniella pini CBS 10737 TaxID=1296096 RepID=A0A1B9HZ54_9TREE|nr:uncharacterized protein I206_05313 [Kwoniella pini CBS 10737]OCF48534.1 hypothetical protein I206_05313 [Kwoniella pini CBS 10737]
MALFLVAFFITPSIVMILILAISVFAMLVYVPATIGLTARLKVTQWDRAWGEVVYLVFQATLWLANAIVGGIVGGPSYCSERLYELGKIGGTSKYSYEPITSIQTLCNGFSAQIALSSIHVVALLLWIWWIYKTVTKLSLRKSASNPEKSLWNISVGELMRRDIRYNRKYDEEESPNGVTPFVILPQSPNSQDEQITSNVSVEPERDIGPYIPPPPYQNSYESTSPRNIIPETPSLTNINSASPINPNYASDARIPQSPTNESTSEGTDPMVTSPSTQTVVKNEQQIEQRTTLRRAMDEKEDSKDVIRRALQR